MIWLKRGSGCASDLGLGGIAGNVANIHHGSLGPFAAAIGARIRVFNSIGPQGAPKVAREFWVERQEAPFMYEGLLIQVKVWTQERNGPGFSREGIR